MFFLNFGLVQFLMIAGAASVFTAALYLLDRSRRKQVVSTLRFWSQARLPVQTSRRRNIRQPWSLLLQLLGVLLLLAAIAQPRLGNPFGKPGYHVLVLETSAWMGARPGLQAETLMETARKFAAQWLNSVPANDRVMVVRADALATPATAFETDRAKVRAAITDSEPGATSLDIQQAFDFARHAQSLQGGAGEIAFVGSGRVRDRKETASIKREGLRAILVPDDIENIGLRRMSAKRAPGERDQWEILISVHNYGLKAHAVSLVAGFNGAPVGRKRVILEAGADQESRFTWRSGQAGLLEARITTASGAQRQDGFSDDDRASLLLPAESALSVTVYTNRPDVLRPLFAANSRVQAEFRVPAAYRKDDKGLVILDRFAPALPPQTDSIWIDPTPSQSPIGIAKIVDHPRGLRWIANHALGEGLRGSEAKLESASIVRTAPGDLRVAEIDDGPIVIARPGIHKMVVIGFDPGSRGMRYQLSTPLVFANILRWIDPDIFRQSDFSVQSAGTVAVAVDPGIEADQLRVTRDSGSASVSGVPFTLDRASLHLFSGVRDTVRVASRDRESLYALTLPEMWDAKWEPPTGTLRGVPTGRPRPGAHNEIWPWLAVLGAGCFITEWLLFARTRRARVRSIPVRRTLRRAT